MVGSKNSIFPSDFWAFLRDANVTVEDEVEQVETEPSDEEGVQYYVVIIGKNGEEIDRIPVEEGQETRIEGED